MPLNNKYKCKNCASCCTLFKLPVKNEEELIQKFKDHFGFELDDYVIEVIFRGSCVNLDGNKCMIHQDKPDKCKEYLCKRFVTNEIPKGSMYQKRCRVCNNMRTFQAGTHRDMQSVCGNCWVWL